MNEHHFDAAVAAARSSYQGGGLPIGSALARGGRLLASAHNERVQQGDPTAHAEIACLRQAGRQSSYADTVLYTTLAPCAMCTGAILQFKIPTVVIGEAETFEGDLARLRQAGVEVTVLDNRECIELMGRFIGEQPQLWAEDIGE
ncbi:nucleoside deaminase [Arthrobacter castelli]|uniref:nucleoside deaminase n=1 Tax=Arthrobacter castelli TaxID=271431 RepID=UPI000425CE79|nr:nucleoside deaminase [Arthrobacter castelli]